MGQKLLPVDDSSSASQNKAMPMLLMFKSQVQAKHAIKNIN